MENRVNNICVHMTCMLFYNGSFVRVSSAGAVCTKVVHEDVVLLGSSGGVYALLAAHLADIILVSSLCARPACLHTHVSDVLHVRSDV